MNLVAWHRRFIDALGLPDAIATGLLAEELRLSIGEEANTKIAVWLEARPDLRAYPRGTLPGYHWAFTPGF